MQSPIVQTLLLSENDTDGRMALLMVTGYAQGPFVPNDHGVWCQQSRARCPTYDRRDETPEGVKVTTLKHR